MEIDIDRLAWDAELFTAVPHIEDGHLLVPDTPGWGIEPNEEGLRAHPAQGAWAAELRPEEELRNPCVRDRPDCDKFKCHRRT